MAQENSHSFSCIWISLFVCLHVSLSMVCQALVILSVCSFLLVSIFVVCKQLNFHLRLCLSLHLCLHLCLYLYLCLYLCVCLYLCLYLSLHLYTFVKTYRRPPNRLQLCQKIFLSTFPSLFEGFPYFREIKLVQVLVSWFLFLVII